MEENIGEDHMDLYGRRFYPNMRFYLPLIFIRAQYFIIMFFITLPVFYAFWNFGQYTARMHMRKAEKQKNNRYMWYVMWFGSYTVLVTLYLCMPIAIPAIYVLPLMFIASLAFAYAIRATGIEM
jgi:hypothetical protein